MAPRKKKDAAPALSRAARSFAVSREFRSFLARKMPRLLHTMLRVGNLAKSVDFYTRILGMTVLAHN
jgi:catechol-2,3-dioxygenase